MTKDEQLIAALRDALLVEADGHNTRADIFDLMCEQKESGAVLRKRLEVAAGELRKRAEIINAMLAATASETNVGPQR